MKCPACDSHTPSGRPTCTRCGAALPAIPQPPEQEASPPPEQEASPPGGETPPSQPEIRPIRLENPLSGLETPPPGFDDPPPAYETPSSERGPFQPQDGETVGYGPVETPLDASTAP